MTSNEIEKSIDNVIKKRQCAQCGNRSNILYHLVYLYAFVWLQ